MMRRILALLAASAFASACPAQAESDPIEQHLLEMNTAQAEVWQGEIDYWDRVNSRDLSGYLDLWHPDFTGWPCGAAGPADLSGLAEFADGWFAGMTARGQRTVPTAEAVIVKNGFAVTYLSAVTNWTEAGGASASKREKFVHTWQATDDGWKIIGGMCAPLVSYDAAETSDPVAIGAAETARGLTTKYSLFPSDRSLTHAEDGVVLPNGRLLVGDWDHGLVTLAPDGTKEPFGNFAAAGFRTKPDPLWNSPNGVSFEPDGRHVLVADITGGHIYRVDTQTKAVTRIYDHPFGVNAAVRDPSGAIWFTQSTENAAGEGAEARMFAAADKPLGDGAVWRIAPDQVGKPDAVATKVVEGLDFANGIAFDAPRGKLYVAEILRSRILSFAVELQSGELSDRRILVTLPTPDNIELDAHGMLWVASPFANAVYIVDPDTGDRRTVFSPTTDESAGIVAETARRLEAGEPILPLLTPEMWGPMPGLLTGVILAPDGTAFVSNLGDALVRLESGGGSEFRSTPMPVADAELHPPPRPTSSDALLAAPEHHEVLLQNDQVRVLETCVAAGERTKVHAHGWPAVQYVVSWSDFVRRNARGQVIADSRNWEQHPAPGQALWSGPADVHSIENVGSGDLCVIAVELKEGGGEPDLTPILDNRTRVILEGIRSGDVSQIMALYGPISLYSTNNATLLSGPEAIREFWVNVAASPADDATLEVLRIERLGPDAFVEIQKYDVFDQAGARLFGGYASLLWRKVKGRWIIAADVSN